MTVSNKTPKTNDKFSPEALQVMAIIERLPKLSQRAMLAFIVYANELAFELEESSALNTYERLKRQAHRLPTNPELITVELVRALIKIDELEDELKETWAYLTEEPKTSESPR